MFLREDVRHCPRCEESTSHSRRALALPKVVSLALCSAAAWSFFEGGGRSGLAWVLVAAGLLVWLWDRGRLLGIECQRCRWRELAARKRDKPTLDGRTEIHLF